MIIAVDAGNGMTNAARLKGRGIQTLSFPSVRAYSSGKSLGLDYELDVQRVTWGGNKYLVGDDIFLSRRSIERHQSGDRYGNEFHRFLVAVACAQLGVKKGEVDIALFMPPGIFNREIVEKEFRKGGANVALQFSGDKSPRKWKWGRITVIPEGVGAILSICMDNRGNMINEELLRGNVTVMDLGMYTVDVIEAENGNLNPESLPNATWERQGIKAHILDPAAAEIRSYGKDWTNVTTEHIDRAIRKNIHNDAITIQSGSLIMDVTALLSKYAERYAEWIANNILDSELNALRDTRSLILTGGGAIMVMPHLMRWYEDKLVDVADYNVDPVFANAIGGLRWLNFALKS